MSKHIVVIGSSNTDMIVTIERIPKPGETVIGGQFAQAAGGKGANQAVAAARAGAAVTFVARVGDDVLGQQALAGFQCENININYVRKDSSAPSGVAFIFVDQKGENSIAVASGANLNLSPRDIEDAAEVIAQASALVMQLEIPLDAVEAAAALAAQKGVPVILNPAPAQPLSDQLLRNVSILTPNESEAELLTGLPVHTEAEAAAAAHVLHQKGVRTVIITLGSRGAYCSHSESGGAGIAPGFEVQAVDTTAAGDVFNGALAVALAEGKPLAAAVAFANAAGALSVTKAGAQPSVPARADIDAFLQQQAQTSI